jgi:WD40 repeat protein
VLSIKIARRALTAAHDPHHGACDEGCVVVTGADDRCVRVWCGGVHCSGGSSGARWQLLHALHVHEGRVWGVDALILARGSDGGCGGGVFVASCGEDGRACIWGNGGDQLLSNEVIRGGGGGGDVWGLQFCLDGSQLFLACGDSTVR